MYLYLVRASEILMLRSNERTQIKHIFHPVLAYLKGQMTAYSTAVCYSACVNVACKQNMGYLVPVVHEFNVFIVYCCQVREKPNVPGVCSSPMHQHHRLQLCRVVYRQHGGHRRWRHCRWHLHLKPSRGMAFTVVAVGYVEYRLIQYLPGQAFTRYVVHCCRIASAGYVGYLCYCIVLSTESKLPGV